MTDNELIAEFMRFNVTSTWRSVDGSIMRTWKAPSEPFIYPYYGGHHSEGGLSQFETSWDWLMPVVEKIDSLGINHPEAYALQEYTIFAKIDVVHKAVVEFIKWYNQKQLDL